jgi:hypothetical protein
VRIFTGRYFNPNVARTGFLPIRVTLGAPKAKLRFELADTIMELAPDGRTFKMPYEQFREEYIKKVERKGIDWVLARLKQVSDRNEGKDVVLLCYENVEKPGEWCHRRILADWITAQTGEEVLDIPETEAGFGDFMQNLELDYEPQPPAEKPKRRREPDVDDGQTGFQFGFLF